MRITKYDKFAFTPKRCEKKRKEKNCEQEKTLLSNTNTK